VSAVVDHGGVLPPSPSAATSDTRLCAPFPRTRVVVKVARFCRTTPTVLKRAADTTFDDRSRGQVMADTLVERVTGRPAEEPDPVTLNLVMSDQALWGQDNAPAVLDGYGPIPASVAQRLVRDAVVDERSLATLRRLYRHPKSGSLVAMESRSQVSQFYTQRTDRAAAPASPPHNRVITVPSSGRSVVLHRLPFDGVSLALPFHLRLRTEQRRVPDEP